MNRFSLSALLACTAATSTLAATPAPSSYAGQEARHVKALSAEDVTDLKAGKGMGLAKAFELNGYPGPAHVLELATELKLSGEQRAATEQLFASHLEAHLAQTKVLSLEQVTRYSQLRGYGPSQSGDGHSTAATDDSQVAPRAQGRNQAFPTTK